MSRERSTNRSKALKLWLSSGRTMLLKEIAAELGVSDVMIRKWKWSDKWDEIPEKRPRGAPKGNKNAIGNVGGSGGPPGNDKAVKHGFFRKFEPQDPEYLEILEAANEMEPLEMLYFNITKIFQKIIWSQRIMHVQDKKDITKVLKKKKPGMFGTEQEWEYQQPWDKMANAMKAEAMVMREFRAAVKQFLSAAPENDERRTKLTLMETQIEKTKVEIEKAKGGGKNPEAGNWTDSLKEVAKRRKEVKGDKS